MRKQTKTALAILGLFCGGCASDGLSPREDSTNNLSAAVYQSPAALSTTQPSGASAMGTDAVTLPIRAGIVQIGEVAPPESMLKAFGSRTDLFSVVEPMPGIFSDGNSDSAAGVKAAVTSTSMESVRKTAAGMGLNYVLFYGGTVDCTRTPTPLEVFNLTIVGAFIVPSENVTARGKAAGSLMEVASGRTVFYLSADARGDAFLPSFMATDVNETMTNAVRDQLISRMTDQTINRLAAKSGGK